MRYYYSKRLDMFYRLKKGKTEPEVYLKSLSMWVNSCLSKENIERDTYCKLIKEWR